MINRKRLRPLPIFFDAILGQKALSYNGTITFFEVGFIESICFLVFITYYQLFSAVTQIYIRIFIHYNM